MGSISFRRHLGAAGMRPFNIGRFGNNSGNNSLLSKATEQIKDNFTPCNESNFSSTPGRTRTCNQRIRNPLLYPLSYGRINLLTIAA